MLELSPAEWTAVELSLRIAVVATAWALPFGIAIGAGCWRAATSGARQCWTVLFICLWFCRRLSQATSCSFGLAARGRSAPFSTIISASSSPSAGLARRLRRALWDFRCWCGQSGLRSRLSTGGLNTRRRLWRQCGPAFFTVTLPLALPGIIAGVLLCFARALGEFGATITFVSNIPGETSKRFRLRSTPSCKSRRATQPQAGLYSLRSYRRLLR